MITFLVLEEEYFMVKSTHSSGQNMSGSFCYSTIGKDDLRIRNLFINNLVGPQISLTLG